MQQLSTVPLHTMVRFAMWDVVMSEPEPDESG